MNRFFSLFLLTASCLISVYSSEAKAEEQGRYEVSIVTMGIGEELFTQFGHIAVLVEDRARGKKQLYNFGTFAFDDPGLWFEYARGFLNYWLSIFSWSGTLSYYSINDRSVELRTLNLTVAQADEIVRRLEENALPENRYYAYRHYIDNCCTRIRDLLDDVLEGALSRGRNEEYTGRTYRDWTHHALEGTPVMSAVLSFCLGPAIDHPITRWDEQFLPEVLAVDLDETTIGPDKQPLVAKRRTMLTRKGMDIRKRLPPGEVILLITLALLVLVTLGPSLIWSGHKISARLTGVGLAFWGLVAGLGGLLLIIFWVATAHTDTHWNENLFILPVTHLWLVGVGIKLARKGPLDELLSKRVTFYILVCQAVVVLDILLKLGPFIQGNGGVIVLALVMNALALLSVVRAHKMKIAW